MSTLAADDTGPRGRRRSISISLGLKPSHEASAAGPVAQLVEQGTFNPKVAGSSPARPISYSGPLRRIAVQEAANRHRVKGNGPP